MAVKKQFNFFFKKIYLDMGGKMELVMVHTNAIHIRPNTPTPVNHFHHLSGTG